MKKKKVATLMALTMLAVFCLIGCGKSKPAVTPTDATNETDTLEESKGSESGDEGKDEVETAEKDLEPVELTWLLRIPEQADGQKVLDKVNEQLKEEINATLNIQFIDPVSYPEKTKLKLSSGDKFDIMFTSAGYGYYDYASKSAFLPLDDLLKEYAPKTYEMIPEGFWEATKVNGEIFGIPNYQIAARQSTLNIRKEIVDKYDIDTSNLKTVEDMEPVLAMLKEKESDKQFIFGPPGLTFFDTMNYMGIECIGADGTPGCIDIDGTELKVLNQYEHPNFVKLVNTLKAYEEAGYINKDLALVEDQTELLKNGEILVSAIGNYKPGAEAENFARNGYETVYIKITEPYVNTTSILGSLQAINRNSQNPERAMKFLELVNTNPELYNTLVYGIEGEHYNKIEDNKIEVIADSPYITNVPWMIGNTFNGYLKAGTEANVYEETKALNENSKVSRIMGFSFNPEPVKIEISQCATVVDKYLVGFQYGMYDDVAGTLEKFNKELRAAGMDKIIAEKQAQLDTWAASN